MSGYYKRYIAEVENRLGKAHGEAILTEDDIRHLPEPMQKYLRMTGAVGRPLVESFRMTFIGAMRRSRKAGWLNIRAEQHNFFNEPARLFYIKAALAGIPFDGLHIYAGSSASMEIRIANLIKVVDARGEKMDQGETVTLFNDMCLIAPATLVHPGIRWEAQDSFRVKAVYANGPNSVSAILVFNEEGFLVDFVSEDRFLCEDGKTYLSYPWSTPVHEYRAFEGRMVPSSGEAIWKMPDGDYPYIRFELSTIEYNV